MARKIVGAGGPRRATALSGALLGTLLLAGCAVPAEETAATPDPRQLMAEADEAAHVYRSATCECCGEHARHLEDAGLDVVEHVVEDIAAVKKAIGVPEDMGSCHTTVMGGYAVEGHVPAEAIAGEIERAPAIDGIALPGMPSGAPGMPGDLEAPLDIRAFVDGADAGPAR